MKLDTEKALIGLGLGFVLFLAYILTGCFVDQVNIYLNDDVDSNATSRLEQPITEPETKKGKESFPV